MSSSISVLGARFRFPFLKRGRSLSFLMAMLSNWFAGRAVSAPAEQGSSSAPAGKAAHKELYKMVVLTNAVQGKDAEFNDWYNNRHLHDVVACPGFVRAQRFEMVTPLVASPYKYCAIYELETDDPKAAVNELVARHGTDKLPGTDALDPDSYAVVYKVLTPVVTNKK